MIVRVVGLDEQTTATLKFKNAPTFAALCDLKEDDTAELEIKDGAVSFDVAPWRIVSVKVRF